MRRVIVLKLFALTLCLLSVGFGFFYSVGDVYSQNDCSLTLEGCGSCLWRTSTGYVCRQNTSGSVSECASYDQGGDWEMIGGPYRDEPAKNVSGQTKCEEEQENLENGGSLEERKYCFGQPKQAPKCQDDHATNVNAGFYTCTDFGKEADVGAVVGEFSHVFCFDTEGECEQKAQLIRDSDSNSAGTTVYCVYKQTSGAGTEYGCRPTSCELQMKSGGPGKGNCLSQDISYVMDHAWIKDSEPMSRADCEALASEKNEGGGGGGIDSINVTDPGSAGRWLEGMNPLGGLDADGNPTGICAGDFTIGCIMSYVINSIVFPLSGLFLFLMIVWGGYQMVNGSLMGSQNTIQRGQQRIKGAFLGFLMLAAVYWLWGLIQALTGIQIT